MKKLSLWQTFLKKLKTVVLILVVKVSVIRTSIAIALYENEVKVVKSTLPISLLTFQPATKIVRLRHALLNNRRLAMEMTQITTSPQTIQRDYATNNRDPKAIFK